MIVPMSRSDITKQALIVRWYARSQKHQTKSFNIFDKIISLWVAFNSWGTFVTKQSNDRKMIDELRNNKKLLDSYAVLKREDKFRNDISGFARYGILDMRPSYEDRRTRIENQNDFGQILDAVYQVRCNLFHGQKDIMNPHDRELVELSFRILGNVLK